MAKYDLNLANIICVNLKGDKIYNLFAIAQKNNLNFEVLTKMREENLIKVWIEKTKGHLIGYEMIHEYFGSVEIGQMVTVEYNDISTRDRDELFSIPSEKTPRLTKIPKNLIAYRYIKNKGFNIQNDSMDKSLAKWVEDGEPMNFNVKKTPSIKELEYELKICISNQDFESCIIIRDDINIIKALNKPNSIESLNKLLLKAILVEDYEKAALIRDKINKI